MYAPNEPYPLYITIIPTNEIIATIAVSPKNKITMLVLFMPFVLAYTALIPL